MNITKTSRSLKQLLFTFGGYAFWGLLILWLLVLASVKGCQSLACYNELVSSNTAADGQHTAQIFIGDCGGATTDFFGYIDVINADGTLAAEELLRFEDRPDQSGIRVKWLSNNELQISMSSLQKIRRINPNGRHSAELKVRYQFTTAQPTGGNQ